MIIKKEGNLQKNYRFRIYRILRDQNFLLIEMKTIMIRVDLIKVKINFMGCI